MIDIKGNIPCRRGESALMRADNEAAVTWVRRCRGGGKKQSRVGALMRTMGALEAKGGWWFRANNVRDEDNISRRSDQVARGPDSRETECRMSWNRLAGAGGGNGGAAYVVGDIARGYAFG